MYNYRIIIYFCPINIDFTMSVYYAVSTVGGHCLYFCFSCLYTCLSLSASFLNPMFKPCSITNTCLSKLSLFMKKLVSSANKIGHISVISFFLIN